VRQIAHGVTQFVVQLNALLSLLNGWRNITILFHNLSEKMFNFLMFVFFVWKEITGNYGKFIFPGNIHFVSLLNAQFNFP
jgi:hypothetical protein